MCVHVKPAPSTLSQALTFPCATHSSQRLSITPVGNPPERSPTIIVFPDYFISLLPFPFCMESTLYDFLLNVVFLPCEHGLDFDNSSCDNSFNQSINPGLSCDFSSVLVYLHERLMEVYSITVDHTLLPLVNNPFQSHEECLSSQPTMFPRNKRFGNFPT